MSLSFAEFSGARQLSLAYCARFASAQICMTENSTASSAFLGGAWDTLPLIIAAIPFGIVYGALAVAGGFSEAITMAMSLLVFAGSSQFIVVTLVAAMAAAPVIVLTVFIVNLRHMLYSASLMSQMQHYPQWVRAPLAFWLTDETYAVVANRLAQRPEDGHFIWYFLGSSLAMYGNWALCSWLGMRMGQQVPDLSSWGLEVAMVVAFIGIVVPSLRQPSHWICAAVAVVSAVLTRDWPHQTGLLASGLLAICAGMLFDRNPDEPPNNQEQQHV